jgi:hypothetical protein
MGFFEQTPTSGAIPLNPSSSSKVASGCPSLNGDQQQTLASFLTYTDASGKISIQTISESGNSLIAICVYPSGEIKTTTFAQTIDSSISSKWSTAKAADHLDCGRLTGTDTLPIDGSSYSHGTVSPNPTTIVMVIAHVMGTICPALAS